MKVFISWSGPVSRQIAVALRDWLQNVLQFVTPWMSDHDIQAGERWNQKLTDQLEQTNVGIVCLTPENEDKPWLHFEAGCISKIVGSGVMIPLLHNVNRESLVGPMTQFQAEPLHKEGMLRVIESIYRATPSPPVEIERVRSIFGLVWPSFEDQIDKLPEAQSSDPVTHPSVPQQWSEAIGSLSSLPEFEVVRVFASGSEHYYYALETYLAETRAGGFRVKMLLRCAEDDKERKPKVLTYLERWSRLAEEYDLDLDIRYYDFIYMLRGLCFDRRLAITGYYVREDGLTRGSEVPVALHHAGEALGDYYISQFIRVHDVLFADGRSDL